jgi:mannose-6-phosphate isomerase-like protein (cupin superfamily)
MRTKLSLSPICLNNSFEGRRNRLCYMKNQKRPISEEKYDYYEERLKDSEQRIERNKSRKKILKPEDMPWENSRQGLIKHLFNEKMDVQVESMDAYMQFIPPGSRSGKHRHMSEEYMFILEGKGYDLHWDVDFELGEKRTSDL